MTTFHAYLGSSLDGFIAGPDGDLDWLTRFNEELGETGYDAFFASVDLLVMGRATYETMLGLDPYWYQGKPIWVLSGSLAGTEATRLGDSPVRFFASVADVVAAADAEGYAAAYVDGGRTVQGFLAAGLLSDIVITRVPVVLGEGIPLFGTTPAAATLVSSAVLGAGAVQSKYAFTTA